MTWILRKQILRIMVIRSNILFHVYLVISTMASFIAGVDITYTIKEEQVKDIYVGNVGEDYNLSSLMPVNEFNYLNYGMLSTGNIFAPYFRISNNTGVLYTTAPIDRENITQCLRSLICVLPLEIAVQANIGAFFRKIKIDIVIEDTNDNSPIFPKDFDTVQFYENSADGSFASIAGAQDTDSGNNSVVNYYANTQDLPFYVTFAKYPDGSSFVKIVVNGSLDREIRDFYQMTVVAVDGGDMKRSGGVLVNITILDVNDNSPIFNSNFYNVTISEDIALNTVLATVYATDADIGDNSDIWYKFSPNQGAIVAKTFAVHLKSGQLSVIGQLVYIPNELTRVYIDASDRGVQSRTSQTVVYVTVLDSNNNPPQINVNILQSGISEYANVGAVVALIDVIDMDTSRNGKVDCVCNSDNFGLERYDINEYKAVVINTLDRELRKAYGIKIVCQDNGSPPLNSTTNFTINVLDENDNTPRFTQRTYFSKVSENNKVGDVVATVSATDIDTGDNARLEYELVNTGGYRFWIDQIKGEIRANFVLDRENISQIIFNVLVHDFGKPPLTATTTIILSVLDENDNYPVFIQESYDISVTENVMLNTSVYQLNSYDSDYGTNGLIVLLFAESPPSSFPFTLSSDGYIKIAYQLDREIQSEYIFNVIAMDQGSPPLNSSVTVTVTVLDVNDNAPVFVFPNTDNNTAAIPLSSTPESVTIVVSSTDNDEGVNGQLTYSFLNNNHTSLFSIENVNGFGIIRLQHMPGTSESMSYKLAITSSDNGTPKQSTTESLTIIFTTAVLADDNKHNFVIAICIGCVTVVLSFAILLTIYLIRRHDKLRKKDTLNYNGGLDMEIAPSDIKPPVDLVSLSSGSKESLKRVSFSIDHSPYMEFESQKCVPLEPLIGMDNTKTMQDDRAVNTATTSKCHTPSQHDQDLLNLDPGSIVQIRSFIQSRDRLWINQNDRHTSPLTADRLKHNEDNGSASSGETVTYDSGRGGSESDIQTSLSQSHDKDHIKAVSFTNKPILKCFKNDNEWNNACDDAITNLFYYNHKPIHLHSKPTLPAMNNSIAPNTYSRQNKHKLAHGNTNSPINESTSHGTLFYNDDDGDDDDTTTSGSYTIDNDRDWTNESHPPLSSFLSHRDAYC